MAYNSRAPNGALVATFFCGRGGGGVGPTAARAYGSLAVGYYLAGGAAAHAALSEGGAYAAMSEGGALTSIGVLTARRLRRGLGAVEAHLTERSCVGGCRVVPRLRGPNGSLAVAYNLRAPNGALGALLR